MYLEFDNFSYVMYFFTRHGHWHDARDLIEWIPVVCFEIVGLFDHESPLVVTPLNSLDSDQARNFIRFQTAWNYDVYMNSDPVRDMKDMFNRS